VRHRPLDAEFSWHRDLVRRGLLAANAVVAPSRSFARDLRQVYDLPFTPMVVNNGRRSANTETRHIPVQEALAVGRLWDEAKNATVLDHAAALARTPLSAIGAARGPQGQEFRAEHLRHIGHLSDDELAQMLARRPIFVSTAIFEPFGLAILEAAAAGCALVLSDIPTFRELWNGAAVFVSANDAQGFADAVDLLATDQPRRTDLGKRAATRAARYTPESCVALTAAIYDNLLAQEEVAA
jgi:glycosyltransferase involved in cell wall biosynthesis